MKSHLQRLEEEELTSKKQKKKNIRMGRLMIAVTLFGFALFSLLTIVSTIDPKNSAEAKEPGLMASAEEDPWELILVNTQNILPKDFTVDLIRFENTRVDCRIADPLQKMIDAAKEDGINLSVCSGYRSVKEQDMLYDGKCLIYISEGYSEEASKILASQYIQTGGTSEHHTGLAVDLLTDGITDLTESFADAPAYSWLKENAAKYGFIERYPEGKEEYTGILWEPWHYRYVGKENAEAITSEGLCLEEYLKIVNGKS